MIVERWGIDEGTVKVARIVAGKTDVLEKIGEEGMAQAWQVVPIVFVEEYVNYKVPE